MLRCKQFIVLIVQTNFIIAIAQKPNIQHLQHKYHTDTNTSTHAHFTTNVVCEFPDLAYYFLI